MVFEETVRKYVNIVTRSLTCSLARLLKTFKLGVRWRVMMVVKRSYFLESWIPIMPAASNLSAMASLKLKSSLRNTSRACSLPTTVMVFYPKERNCQFHRSLPMRSPIVNLPCQIAWFWKYRHTSWMQVLAIHEDRYQCSHLCGNLC